MKVLRLPCPHDRIDPVILCVDGRHTDLCLGCGEEVNDRACNCDDRPIVKRSRGPFSGYRETCYLCDQVYGRCVCPDMPARSGFIFEGMLITDPSVDETGRFYVEPEVYYGQAFKDWRDGR